MADELEGRTTSLIIVEKLVALSKEGVFFGVFFLIPVNNRTITTIGFCGKSDVCEVCDNLTAQQYHSHTLRLAITSPGLSVRSLGHIPTP